jgi:hypothetical protein
VFIKAEQFKDKDEDSDGKASNNGQRRLLSNYSNPSKAEIFPFLKRPSFFLSHFRYCWLFQANEDKLCPSAQKHHFFIWRQGIHKGGHQKRGK